MIKNWIGLAFLSTLITAIGTIGPKLIVNMIIIYF